MDTTTTYPDNIVQTLSKDKTRIKATCQNCKEKKSVPNKGLGRASLAAWKTNHQH